MASLRYASYLEEEDWNISTLELVNDHLHRYLNMLPGGGADLTLSELQGLAARQQVAMDTQQQALVARETRLKYLQQQEARHRQLAAEQARLQRMKDRVEAQELKLRKLRALRGQVEQYKASNGNLNTELEAVRALFNEKEKELAVAVTRVDTLMRQLQDLRHVKANGVVAKGNKGDSTALTLELEKLRKELLHRNKMNEQQTSRLNAQRQLLQQRKDEAAKMDNRIQELQQRLKKRRSQQQQQQEQQQSITKPSKDQQGARPGQNVATVEPYIQQSPKDAFSRDDMQASTGAMKQDPKKLTERGQEVNNNNDKNGGSGGMKAVEYKIPSIISSHFGANRGRGASPGREDITGSTNQARAGGVGAGGPAEPKPTAQPPSSQGLTLPSSQQQAVTGAKGPRPFVNTFGKSGLPRWPPQPNTRDEDSEQSPTSQLHHHHHHHQPQINIFDEERQAGSGQSSPASSEGSGPLVKQGSGVFAHPLASASPQSQATAAAARSGQTAGQTSKPDSQRGGAAPGPPVEPRGHSGRKGPKPPPRMPTTAVSAAPLSPADQRVSNPTAESASVTVRNSDTTKPGVSDSSMIGMPQAASPPDSSSQTQQEDDGNAGTTIHLNQRPAPTYRYAPKSVIANTYMGRLGNAALERYQQLNKQLYPTLDAHSKRGSTPPSSAQNSPAGTPRESGTAVNPQQPSSPDAPKVRVGSGPDGLTHFGLVGSPSYPDIASDKGSFKSNTPKHVRRRHSDSDSEDLNKVLQRVEKPQLENVEEDVSSGPTSEPQTDTSISSGHRPHGGSNSNIVPSSPTKSQPNETFARRTVEVVRRKKPILKGDNHRKSLNRVSFDPLALLLDASLEGELELVMRTAKEVDDVSTPNDEGITALHNAICAGHYDIVKFLIEFGADANSPDSDGWTPLHCAASCNNLPMVRFLVEHGACIFATTISDNETAAEKCEEDEDGYDGCSDYLYSIQEKLGIANNGTVYAVFDFSATNGDELSFSINDKMMVLRKGDNTEKEWWWARLQSGREGYIPRNLLGWSPRVLPANYQANETSEC